MIFKAKDDVKLRALAHQQGAFNSKMGAFDYFFIVEGKSAEEAQHLANIVTSARGVPEKIEPALNTFEKIKNYIRQGNELATENPRITDFLIGLFSGAVTSLGGAVVGSKISENTESKYEINNNVEPKELDDVKSV